MELTREFARTRPSLRSSSLSLDSQYAFDSKPVAEHDDVSVPVYRRLFRGPNAWPDASALPGFRPCVTSLTDRYHRLTHDLGHLITESLGEAESEFDEYFDFQDPDLVSACVPFAGLPRGFRGGVGERNEHEHVP